MRKNPSWFSRDAARRAAAKRWAAEKDADPEPHEKLTAKGQTLGHLADKFLRGAVLGKYGRMFQLKAAQIIKSLPREEQAPGPDIHVHFRRTNADAAASVESQRNEAVSKNETYSPDASDASDAPQHCDNVNNDGLICAKPRPCAAHESAVVEMDRILADSRPGEFTPKPPSSSEPRTWADAARKDDAILASIGYNPNRSKLQRPFQVTDFGYSKPGWRFCQPSIRIVGVPVSITSLGTWPESLMKWSRAVRTTGLSLEVLRRSSRSGSYGVMVVA